jgi:class 3 adenylate cyclase/tetratricopeptide (TPR) repeat protein
MAESVDVDRWLVQLGLPQYAEAFRAHAIDLDTLWRLSDADLREIGVAPLGHRKRMLADLGGELRPAGGRPDPAAELKLVTVLFADIAESTALIASLDPETSQALLGPVVRAMTAPIERFGGTVVRIAGDGLLAVFGAPVAREDHAARACHAALALHGSVGALASRPDGARIRLRVGLHSGEVLVLPPPPDKPGAMLDVVGPVVWLAARMEQAADPGSIRLTRSTARLVENLFRLESLGPISVKGFSQPVDAFLLQGAQPAAGRAHPARTHEFVGRERELHALADAAADGRVGRGRIVGVAGEPGVGKSRLIAEFLRSPAVQGFSVKQGGAAALGETNANQPFVDMLTAHFDVPSGLTLEELAARLASEECTANPALAAAIKLMLVLTDRPVDIPDWDRLGPEDRRHHTKLAFQTLLREATTPSPMVIAFEDLHWVEESTQALLDAMAEALPTLPAVLVVTYRPEYSDPWTSRSCHTRIWLDPFSDAASDALLSKLIGDDPGTAELKRRLVSLTSGNALFLGESVQSLVEDGVLSGTPGHYRLARPVGEIDVPASVHSIIAARFDRRSPEERQILQIAAVLGVQFPLKLLAAVLARSEAAVASVLSGLQGAELIHQVRSSPTEYVFKHALIRDEVYRGLLKQRRRELHATIVDMLEADPTEAAQNVERLAYHASEADDWEKAALYNQQAAARAQFRSSNREAMRYFAAAADAIDKLSESPQRQLAAIDVRLDMRLAFFSCNKIEELFDHVTHARRMAEAVGDERRAGLAIATQTLCHWRRGALTQGLEAAREVASIAAHVDDLDLAVMADFGLGQMYHAVGEYAKTVVPLRAVMERAGTDLGRHNYLVSRHAIHARSFLGCSLAELGRFDEGAAVAAEGVAFARQFRDGFAEGFASYAAGYVEVRRGDFENACLVMRAALNDSVSGRVPGFLAFLAATTGLALVRLGRVDEGLGLVERVTAKMTKHREFYFQMPFVFLSEAYLAVGRHDDAERVSGETAEFCMRRGEHGFQAWSLWVLGEAALARGDASAARQHLEQAAGLAAALELAPLLERCNRRLAH